MSKSGEEKPWPSRMSLLRLVGDTVEEVGGKDTKRDWEGSLGRTPRWNSMSGLERVWASPAEGHQRLMGLDPGVFRGKKILPGLGS